MPISKNLLERLTKKDPKLTSLNLSRHYPDLTTEDMKVLASVLQGNPYITKLGFCEAGIKDEGARILAEILPTMPSLVELDVSVNDIGDVGATALFGVTTLRFLNIAANHVTDKAAEQLLRNITLHYVHLDGNSVTANLITQIEKQLESNERRYVTQLKVEFKEFIENLPFEELKSALAAAKKSVQEGLRETPSSGGPS